SVVLPSFADIADEAMPAVVSITSTNIVKGGSSRRNVVPFGGQGGDGDPFEFFFGPRRGQPQQRDDEEHKDVQGGTGFVISDTAETVPNYLGQETPPKTHGAGVKRDSTPVSSG